MAAKAAAALKKTLEQREDILSEFGHCVKEIEKFKANTKPTILAKRLEFLESIYCDFNKNKKQLMSQISKEDQEEVNEIREQNNEIADQYVLAVATINDFMPEGHDISFASHKTQEKVISQIQLPPIKIKPFSGSFNDWEEFADSFQSYFRINPNVDGCQKLLQLKTVLTDEPLQLIKTLKATNENFDIAWDILEQRYFNKQKIFQSHFNTILQLPNLAVGNASELKTMLDTTNSSLMAIEVHGISIENIDPFIVHILVLKLDERSRRQWAEAQTNAKELPTLVEFKTFLETRFSILEGMVNRPEYGKANASIEHSSTAGTETYLANNERKEKCTICEQAHRPFQCPEFKSLSVELRKAKVQEKRLCYNCLYKHSVRYCRSRFACIKCSRKHHSLLHEEENTSAEQHPAATSHEEATFNGHIDTRKVTRSMLATARIQVINKDGNKVFLRALIDQGSMSNMISEKAAQLLGSERDRINIPITSIGNTRTGLAKFKTNFIMRSIHNSNFGINVSAMIIKSITSIHPGHTEQTANNWTHIIGLPLADPYHYKPGNIDLLLGAETFSQILLMGLIKGTEGTPMAQNTELGWILSGAVSQVENEHNYTQCNLTTMEAEDLSNQIKKFWETEEDLDEKILTPDEQECMDRFKEETVIDSNGRYKVKLPFKIPPNTPNFLGDSYRQAKARLIQNERRLALNPGMFEKYQENLQEYLDLGHMREATPEESSNMENTNFLPHHAVIKNTSTTTKLRVVFDASAKTSNGFSLNDRLLIGPVVQEDIFSILLRWRTFAIGFCADIEKMYRQICVDEGDVNYQRILWRKKCDDIIRQYIMLRITFGTASAAFQATAAIDMLAEEIKHKYPLAYAILKESCYVDDIASGAHTLIEAIEKQMQLNKALEGRGFVLRKWTTNSKALLEAIPKEHRETSAPINEQNEIVIKALGIKWHPETDTFRFSVHKIQPSIKVTKRILVSEIAMLFDPLGWLGPIIIMAKKMIQEAWTRKIKWDQILPNDLNDKWRTFCEQLPSIEHIRIPRWINYSPNNLSHSIHAFSDASLTAYASCIYLRSTTSAGVITCHLLAAKTKVAPLKTLPIPKLELCGAVLLCKLLKKVKKALKIENIPVFAWTDSMIVLAWISSHPARWKTFIANRVAKIQTILTSNQWHHVTSENNAADIPSRGILPDRLRDLETWWLGPEFLRLPESQWPSRNVAIAPTNLEEKRNVEIFFIQNPEDPIQKLIESTGNLQKLLRTIAYCRRIVHKQTEIELLASEIENALIVAVKRVQSEHFAEDIQYLKTQQEVSKHSNIKSLSPFIDENGVLRVEGRLQHSNLNRDAKNPIILPNKGHFTRLVIEHNHIKTLHGGLQLTMNQIRQTFWIIRERQTVKNQLYKCVRCHRYKAKLASQKMGHLPAPRINQSRPFAHTGVDFAGYFEVKTSTRRNAPFTKCYVALFICLATKAIHLELVSDLTADAFIASLRRFSARRACPNHMYSDMGTNFVGANNQLINIYADTLTEPMDNEPEDTNIPKQLFTKGSPDAQKIIKNVTNEGIQWHFNPPHAPHFGGLWEAGVKSTKYHLKRVLGGTRLVYEDFNTILIQIEAVLNSRPLCPMNADAGDPEALTPGHFLIGQAITMVPGPSLLHIQENRLDRYQKLQKMLQEFWIRWREEYLHRMQERPKWTKTEDNLKVGQLVLVKDDNLPPAKWNLARIIATHPGEDGKVRTVSIRIKHTTAKRPIHKLAPLPVQEPYDG